jgi:hypothetical protein
VTMEFQEKGVELVVELPKVLANVFRWSSYWLWFMWWFSISL